MNSINFQIQIKIITFIFALIGLMFGASTNVFAQDFSPTPTPTATATASATPTSTDSSSSSSPSSSEPSAPSCNDPAPTSAPDLFQIDKTATTATLYFAMDKQPVTSYHIFYGLDSSASSYSDIFGYTGLSWTIKRTINSLSPHTTYYFKVRAGNGCNAGPWSKTVSVTTLSETNTNTTIKSSVLSVKISPPSPTPTLAPTPTPEPTAEPTVTLSPSPILTPEPSVLGAEKTQSSRSAFVSAVLAPNEITVNFKSIVLSGILAVFVVLLIMFPSELFNSTVQSNYDEIIKWPMVHRIRSYYEKVNHTPTLILVTIFVLIGALINSLLSSDFGFNKATLSLFLGMLIALFVISVVYDVTRSIYMKKRFGYKSELRAHSLGLVTGLILVAISRFASFIPGYCYGVFTALVFKQNIDDRQNGEGLAFGATALIIVALVGWFAWIPIKSVATSSDPSFWILAIDASFASLWVSMLTSTVFGLLPMRFMYGETIKKWNSKAWALIYFTGVFLFIYTILNPAVVVYGSSDKILWFAVIALFLGFGLFSFLFWGYFRYRYLWSGSSKNQ